MKTCSKESGARLVELGVTKESYFIWHKDKCSARMDRPSGFMEVRPRPPKMSPTEEWYPAYTACELGEMLPESIRMTDHPDFVILYAYQCHKRESKLWWTRYKYHDGDCLRTYIGFQNQTEAEARALMLIWLLEQGRIPKEDTNGLLGNQNDH